MVILSPIIRLDNPETFEVLKAIPVKLVSVRLQDLISKNTFKFNKTYEDILSSGGLHSYLNFEGEILLSLIMKDEMIFNLRMNDYVESINLLKPDFFTTLDGETYEGEFYVSWKEIDRINKENQKLLELCQQSKPIGLVKGCSEKQIDYHVEKLKSSGIENFIFHNGDFFRYGDSRMIRKARSYCYRIRKEARTLFLYGMGSQRRLIDFSFADVYITFKHFVSAINRIRFIGTKQVRCNGRDVPQILKKNFIEMHKNLKAIETQTKLCEGY